MFKEYLEMCNCIKNQSRRRSNQPVCAVPNSDSRGLFFSFPPARCYEHETWIETGFEYAEEETRNRESCKIRRTTSSGKSTTLLD
jgi:hypothetical protein